MDELEHGFFGVTVEFIVFITAEVLLLEVITDSFGKDVTVVDDSVALMVLAVAEIPVIELDENA